MNRPLITINRLRGLIGQRLYYQGTECLIIEVLEDGPNLVLQEFGPHTIIQSDQYDEAHRRVPATFTIPVHDKISGTLNPALGDLCNGLLDLAP